MDDTKKASKRRQKDKPPSRVDKEDWELTVVEYCDKYPDRICRDHYATVMAALIEKKPVPGHVLANYPYFELEQTKKEIKREQRRREREAKNASGKTPPVRG